MARTGRRRVGRRPAVCWCAHDMDDMDGMGDTGRAVLAGEERGRFGGAWCNT